MLTSIFARRSRRSETAGRAGGVFLSLALCLWAPIVVAAPSAPEIFPNDKLLLNIVEWLPAEGNYRAWDDLKGPYAVADDRTIRIPFVGALTAAGRTPDQLADEIAEALFRKMSLPTKPSVSIAFVDRSKVFVLGGVTSPGAIDFAADLTATQAIASAGGYFRDAGGTLRIERDAITAQGALDLAQYQAARSAARLSRLEAEIADKDTVELDGSRWPVEVSSEMVGEEQKLLDIRRNARDTRLKSIANLYDVAEKQTEALREKAQNIERQLGLANSQLSNVSSLVQKGLAVSERSFALERTVADLQGQQIDLELATLQAQLEASQAQRDEVDVRSTYRSEASTELQTTRSELQENLNTMRVSRELLQDSLVSAPAEAVRRAGGRLVDIRINLTRVRDGVSSTVPIAGDELLQPGDTIQVELIPHVGESADVYGYLDGEQRRTAENVDAAKRP